MASGVIKTMREVKYADVTVNIVKNGGSVQTFNTGLDNTKKILNIIPMYSTDYYSATEGYLGFSVLESASDPRIVVRLSASENWTLTLRIAYI